MEEKLADYPEYRQLLAAVLACPDDDTPRLVLADWLQEHSCDARAEFIRVQIALAGFSLDVRDRHRLANRERAIMSRPSTKWWSPYGPGHKVHVLAWRRGFVYEIAIAAADWLAHADEILAQHPVRKVTLATGTETEWSRLQELVTAHRAAGELVWQPTLASLRELWPGIEFTPPPG